MKKYIVMTIMSLALSATAQTARPKYGDFVYCTEDKDTLYLDVNSSMSCLIYEIWENDKEWKGKKPVILFVETAMIAQYKEREEATYLAKKRRVPRP
jgi:hypothetical protein